MKDSISSQEYLYWLSHIPFLGAVSGRKVFDLYPEFNILYNIEERELTEQKIMPKKAVEHMMVWKAKIQSYQDEYHSLERHKIRFISIIDKEYPIRLKPLHGMPLGLYVKGMLPKEERPTAAIVGARACTSYGSQIAEYLGESLSKHGIQIISGLAEGIDGAGHRGALQGAGSTYGILGCGINICYPKENYKIYEHIQEQGGVITEFGLNESPVSKNFPMRNRIISGLSDAIIIVEAREKSGSLITAEIGLDQGKEIFALPGRVTDPLSKGCNQLIQNGANILLTAEDVLEYFRIKYEKKLTLCEKNVNSLAKKEKIVYSCLDLQPEFLEHIIKNSGFSASECMSILLNLELGGYIIQTANHYYAKKL